MADFTTNQNRSGAGWLIGAVVVVLLLLFIVFGSASGTATSSDPAATGTTGIEQAPAAAPAAD
jgi:hypothetical protein